MTCFSKASPMRPIRAAQDSAARLDGMMRRYVARLEHYCREAPFNWFNFYDFWA